MKIASLYSSSSGNSFLISEGDTKILIDAGKNAKKLCSALCLLGVNICDIDAVFITHCHTDHVSALPVLLSKTNLEFHMTRESLGNLYDTMPNLCLTSRIYSHESGFAGKIGSLTVESFPLPHDCPGTQGYIVTNQSGEKYVHATDVGCFTPDLRQALKGADYLTIESNYDPDMLAHSARPDSVKARITSPHGHISNGEARMVVKEALCGGTKSFMLAHISPEANTPELALLSSSKAIIESGISDVKLIYADRENVTKFVGC